MWPLLALRRVPFAAYPDTLLKPGAISILVKYLQEHAGVGAVGPRIFSPDGLVQQSAHPTPPCSARDGVCSILTGCSRQPVSGSLLPRHPATAGRCNHGSCMLIRRAAVEKVGLLDEQFFVYSKK